MCSGLIFGHLPGISTAADSMSGMSIGRILICSLAFADFWSYGPFVGASSRMSKGLSTVAEIPGNYILLYLLFLSVFGFYLFVFEI